MDCRRRLSESFGRGSGEVLWNPVLHLDQLQHEIREQCLDQPNYLSSYALSLTGLELTPYNEYLLDLREKMPALNHLGFLASDGTWYRWNDSDAPEEDLEYERQYECRSTMN